MIEKIYNYFRQSTGICTDTRQLKPGNLFFALRGPSFNANQFARQAIDAGAVAAVIDDSEYEITDSTILVADGLSALQDLARYHRAKLKIPIIGITGSNGKTTSKELVHAVLSSHFNTFATQGNLNNHIGVPLSVLSITEKHEMAVIEMGANHIGEIAELCTISQPTHGFITNIGKAHIGLFGGFEGVIRAKSELYNYLIKTQGTIFVNQNQEILMNMSKRMAEPVFYPNEGSFCKVELLGADPYVSIKTQGGGVLVTKLVGRYNFDNIATALCVGKYFQVPEGKAIKAVAEYVPENNRSQIVVKGSNTIILDAYNANPSSMEKALENLAGMEAENKVAIIGDMFELGDDTDQEHRAMGELARQLGLTEVYFCGKSMQLARDAFGGGYGFETRAALIDHLKSHPISGSTILIKASRGMALEQVVEVL
ncbi:MAG: UDP-N-acetylmuramoyl-tripeptide--D-alanyl-D-alanine ligase [Cyclobacteriaceae bacterium]|nr:UDP-N-acetylmuramoyl-tripeptide--D-alanyl-D-alanine ligase [Cyclobacteriaceae bacterium]